MTGLFSLVRVIMNCVMIRKNKPQMIRKADAKNNLIYILLWQTGVFPYGLNICK